MGREGARDKGFFVKLASSSDEGFLTYETYYTNIRNKRKQIEMFKNRISEMGKCEESDILLRHCSELEQEIAEYTELFRGRVSARKGLVIYVPMDVKHVFEYLGHLVNEGIEKNRDWINKLLSTLENETGVIEEDKKTLRYYKELINWFKLNNGKSR